MICAKCGTATDEIFDRFGQKLCEDCYLEALSPVKTCDPWAVHSAKGLSDQQGELTSSQKRILDRLAQGPVEVGQLVQELGLPMADLERDFAALRHMEKVRGFPFGEKKYIILFHQTNPEWAQA